MSKISLDLSSIKSAGVYTLEIDESQRTESQIQALRLLVGFGGKGPYNRPVLLQNEAQRQKVLGDIDTKLEKKGCFFNRAARTMLQAGPVLALNLLKVDDSYEGTDQVNYASLSLDAAKSNPRVTDPGKIYGEVDYLADTIDSVVYNTSTGDMIPFVGKTPYASLFDRSRFWTPSENNLLQVAAAGLGVGGTTSFEKSNFLNFANCGTDEISILVFKPEGFTGYDITAKDWYGGTENIPYGWIRPSDYISDYFIRVVAVKGNWSNYPLLSSDKTWGKYFDKKGIKKDKIFSFCQAEGITFVGSWTGVIIPDFTDKQGNYLYIKDRVNAQTITSNVLMSINEDAMEVISYDLNGIDRETGQEGGRGSWIYDYNGDAEADSGAGETEIDTNSGHMIDMVGHGFQNGIKHVTETKALETTVPSIVFDGSTGTLGVSTNVWYLDDVSVAATKTATGYEPVTNVKIPVFEGADKKYLYNVYDVSTKRPVDDVSSYVSFTAAKAKTNTTTDKLKGQKGWNIDGVESKSTIGTLAANNGYTAYTINVKNAVEQTTDASAYFGNYAAYNKTNKVLYMYSIDSAGVQDQGSVTTDDMTETTITVGSAKKTVYKYAVKSASRTIMLDASTGNIYVDEESNSPEVFGVNFMSYDYVSSNPDEVLTTVRNCYYFNGKKNGNTIQDYNGDKAVKLEDSELFFGNNPVSADTLNQFIITSEQEASYITVGDLVPNITFQNRIGDATRFGLIPGVTRVTKKIFVSMTSDNKFSIGGKTYSFNTTVAAPIRTRSGKRGFYLFTTIDPVLIDPKYRIVRQLPISSAIISESLRFIPLKGLQISAKHKPGYTTDGRIDINGGIKKIYSVLEEDGIRRSLTSTNTLAFRYIVDSCSFGIDEEFGGKVYLSRLAMDRGKTTALINAPSKKEFETSSNPVFCATYDANSFVKPAFDTKYIPLGGNVDMYNTRQFTQISELNGSKYAAAFYPHLVYREGNKTIIVPPAADVSNTFLRKFTGGDPYAIVANTEGILRSDFLTGIECEVDQTDRDYLEPFGINSIISENGNIVIYGNQTCYQVTKSDFNKLHVRENLNTLEYASDVILKQFAFKYNVPRTRAELTQALTPVYEAMKNSRAIEWYEIICDESNNTDEVIANDTLIVDCAVVCSHGAEKVVNRITLKTRDFISE